jgi:hypothetical protein
MAYVGEGNEADYARTEVKGKIAVVDIRFRPMLMGQSKARSYFAYDPKNTIPQGYSHPAIRYAGSPNLQGAYQRAVEAGAAGVVGILQDVPANLYTFYTPYPNPQQFREPVPMMYVGRDDGAALRQQLRTKTVKARLINYGRTEPGVTHTVVGVLPGRSDDAILISSHHDSPFAGAVEDGSGISMVLALAKYFGQTPKEQRNKTLWFAAQAGHFYGSVGIRDFAQRHAQDLNPKLLVAVHLEHIAEEFVERNGKLADTGLPEPAFLFVSDNPVLLSAAKEAVVKHDLERTFIVRVTKGSRPYPGGESRFYFTKGVPVIGLASLPVYLLFEEDTLDKVAVERLAPTAAAMAEIIEKIDQTLKTRP